MPGRARRASDPRRRRAVAPRPRPPVLQAAAGWPASCRPDDAGRALSATVPACIYTRARRRARVRGGYPRPATVSRRNARGVHGLCARGSPRRHGRGAGRRVPDGLGRFYPEERPVHRVAVEGFWIDAPGHRRGSSAASSSDGLRHRGRAPARPDGLPGRRSRRCSCPGRSSSGRTRGPVDLRDYRNWWAYVPGRVLAAPGGPRQRRYDARAPPGDPRRLRGRRGLRGVGRQGAADRGGVGVRRARRARRRGLRLGRRVRPGAA